MPLLDLAAKTAVRWVSLGYLTQAEEAYDRLRDEVDSDTLHDFRVALRRLRSAARAFRPELDDTISDRDRRRLRDLAAATGASRDAEVKLERVTLLLAADPEAMVTCESLLARLERTRAGEATRLKRLLRRRFPGLARRLRRGLTEYRVRVEDGALAAEPTARALGRALSEAGGEARGRLAAIGPEVGIDSAHRARIALKRLRYTIEPFVKELEGGETVVTPLRRLQIALGELHDLDVLGIWAGELAARGSDDLAAVRCLAPRLMAAREERAEELSSRWLAGGADVLMADVDRLAASLLGAEPDVEIERKFLLASLPRLPTGTVALEVEQGWFGERYPERVRRVQEGAAERCYRAIKHGAGIRRIELEEEIGPELFAALWPLTLGRRVRKRRYRILEDGLTWEIDAFTDRDLVLAEVELPAADHPFDVPPWLRPHLVREVTHEPAYLNLNLAE